MTATAGQIERHAIPRWRGLADTIASREFASDSIAPLTPEGVASLERAEFEWARHGGVSRASEFVGTALTLGAPERAREAAQFLAMHSRANGARRVAAATLSERSVTQLRLVAPSDSVHDRTAETIARLKVRTTNDPRNAVAWLELARRYTMIGQSDQALQAMNIALALAPLNRYVIRSAVAFYSHRGDLDLATAAVRRHPGLRDDPWLLAADLAAAGEGGITQLNVRPARSLVDSGRFAAIAVSELASELATLELSSASKRTRRLLSAAMIDPTENAAAQAEWAVQELPKLRTWSSANVVAGEAAARHAERQRNWPVATSNAELWLNDQPFSVDAAAFASYVAALGEDFLRAAQLAEVGLRANPDAPVLINNLAYALVEIGELSEAERQLDRTHAAVESDEDSAALLATRGLLAIRKGDWAPGAALYRQSIDAARRAKRPAIEAQAWVMLAREMLAAGADGGDAIDKAISTARGVNEPAVQELLGRLLRSSKLRTATTGL